jgi:hypothetical protein
MIIDYPDYLFVAFTISFAFSPTDSLRLPTRQDAHALQAANPSS